MRSVGFIFISFLAHGLAVLLIYFLLIERTDFTLEPKPSPQINFVEIPSDYLGDKPVFGDKKTGKKSDKSESKITRKVHSQKSSTKNISQSEIPTNSLFENGITVPKSHEIIIPGLMGRQASMKDLIPPAVSQLPPGIEMGELMPLDMDNDIYYNFNKRVRERVVPGWIRRVYNEIWRMYNAGELGNFGKQWRTVVEVRLNKKGEVVDTKFKLLSDSFTMDSALVDSFVEARIFPNPPEGLLDENREVKMTWQINVRYLPSPKFR